MRKLFSTQDKDVYRQFSNVNLPRHTSYPIVPFWQKDWDHFKYEPELISSLKEKSEISLYVHIPFCRQLCYYCACNKTIVPDEVRRSKDPSHAYLMNIARELKILFDHIGRKKIVQLHLGGGSPTFLKSSQITLLIEQIATWFDLEGCEDMAVEIDPRVTTREQLRLLKDLGFNRVSLGVQDFDKKVQTAINRVQDFNLVETFVGWVRELGFKSLNFDLIYGLPFQTVETVKDTVNKVIKLSPDRIAYYRLALIPEVYKWQKQFASSDVPSGDDMLSFNEVVLSSLLEHYEWIGFDHFAKETEALAKSVEDGSVRRNFQGMTTGKTLPIVGVGPSAISDLGGVYSQNEKSLKAWAEKLEKGFLPVASGLSLSKQDVIRKDLINSLYGSGVVDLNAYIAKSREVGVQIDFKTELARLSELVELGLVVFESGIVRLTKPLGRSLARVVGAVFDPYLGMHAFRNGVNVVSLSKV